MWLNFFQNEAAIWFTLIIALWTLPWKGVALWKASRLSHKWWFVALLLVNSLAILEIFYIFYIAKKYSVKVEEG